MDISDVVLQLTRISGLVFVVGSMLAMGLALSIPMIVVSVSNVRVMVLALVANFVVVPAAAYAASQLISNDHPGLRTGLILVGAAAGAPFLPKLVQVARGTLALAAGLMVVLMVVTIPFLPLALPLLLPGDVTVDAWEIASSLIFLMLLPLVLGLFVRARYPSAAPEIQAAAGRASTIGLVFVMVALLVANFHAIIDTVGTRGILAALAVLVVAFLSGWLVGGANGGRRPVLALGTAQRNLSAAIVVAAQNFRNDPEVITMVMIVGVIGLLVLFAAAGDLGRRAMRSTPQITKDPDEARRIAADAYVFAYPMLEFYKAMFGLSLAKRLPTYNGPMNKLHNKTELLDASFTAVVSPNNDTLYTMMMCDLRAEPLVLTVPPVPRERYYSFAFIDQFTHVPAFIGTRMGDTDGGTFLLAGPSWNGVTAPRDVTRVVRVETGFLFCLGRTQVNGDSDLADARALMARYGVQPLSAVVPTYEPRDVEPLRLADIPIYDPVKARSAEFVTLLNWLLGHVEESPADARALARFSKIGVKAGVPFFLDAIADDIRDAIEAGVRDADQRIDAEVARMGDTVNGWHLAFGAFGDRARMQDRWLLRAAAGRVGLFGNPEEEALYPIVYEAATGEDLDGARNSYVLRMPPPPVDAFWSVTMYRLPEKLFVDNPIGRYSIGDRTPGIETATDGSITIRIQHDQPEPRLRANWLPAPDGPFYLILRLYIPRREILDRTWNPPPVEVLDLRDTATPSQPTYAMR